MTSSAFSAFLAWWRRRPAAQRRIALTLALAGWVAHYLGNVRPIRLHVGKGDDSRAQSTSRHRLMRIIKHCRTLRATYWPTWYAHTTLLQFLLLGFKELRARLLQRSPYKRQVLTLRDGADIALDWVHPASDAGASPVRPVCVLLHGAIQDSASVTMVDLACSLADRGLPVVVMNRRGYGGLKLEQDEAKVSMFGFDEDLDEVIRDVAKQKPGCPVAIIGFSCGSGFSGRYVGTRAHLSAWSDDGLRHGSKAEGPQLLCGVAYDPGYNVSPDGAVAKIRPPYSWILNLAMKYCYVYRHREAFSRKSASFNDLVRDLMSPKNGVRQTYRGLRRLSGIDNSSAWLKSQQPELNSICMPSLLINSRDDPICVWENVRENFRDISSNPNLVLAELYRGAHGCKFGFWGFKAITDNMIAEFVQGAWHELQASREAAAV